MLLRSDLPLDRWSSIIARHLYQAVYSPLSSLHDYLTRYQSRDGSMLDRRTPSIVPCCGQMTFGPQHSIEDHRVAALHCHEQCHVLHVTWDMKARKAHFERLKHRPPNYVVVYVALAHS